MSKPSLPATLKSLLEHHIEREDIPHDVEAKQIIQRLSQLNVRVESLKALALQKRAARNGS